MRRTWKYKWIEDELVPFVFLTTLKDQPFTLFFEWVGFDDVKSIKIKVKYLMKMGLGVATLFSLNNDDYEGLYKHRMFRSTLLETKSSPKRTSAICRDALARLIKRLITVI